MISVSIVEDTHEIREGFRNILNGTDGFTCISAYSNAEDALQNLFADAPEIIVMDIGLPNLNGIECVRRLKEKNIRSQVIMFTVYDDDENIYNALQAGASGYILKNTSPAKFIEAVRELSEGGSPMSTYIARRVVSALQKTTPLKEAQVLSARELEILNLLAKGFLYKEIAEKLFISTGTVKQHIHKIYEKLHVQNRTEAINKVFSKSAGNFFRLFI